MTLDQLALPDDVDDPLGTALDEQGFATLPGLLDDGDLPGPGARGHHRVQMRHGVSTVLSGSRHVLGVIFHDAA